MSTGRTEWTGKNTKFLPENPKINICTYGFCEVDFEVWAKTFFFSVMIVKGILCREMEKKKKKENQVKYQIDSKI